MLGKRVPARVNEGFCDRPGHRRRSPCPSSPSSTPIELRARTASFKWQVSPLLLYSLPWHRARTEPSRKVSCQSAYCRATLFGGSREKCFAFRSRSVDGTEYVTHSGREIQPLMTTGSAARPIVLEDDPSDGHSVPSHSRARRCAPLELVPPPDTPFGKLEGRVPKSTHCQMSPVTRECFGHGQQQRRRDCNPGRW